MKATLPSGFAALLALGVTAPAHATPIVVDRGVQSFFAQSVLADIAVEQGLLDFGGGDADVNYHGSTVGTQWQGLFSGELDGGPFTGNMGGHIDAPTPSDPTMFIENGSLIVRGTPYNLSGNFKWDETTGLATLMFNLERAGTGKPMTWTENTPLVYTLKQGGVSDLVGQVLVNNVAYNINVTFTPSDPNKREAPGTIASRLSLANGTGEVVTNRGRGTLSFFANFDGDMDLAIQTVPEPSTMPLFATGVLGLLIAGRRTKVR